MSTLLIVFIVMVLFVVTMSAGLLLGRKPISGSCGGMAAVGMESACDVCGGDKNKCETESKKAGEKSSSADFYDATKR